MQKAIIFELIELIDISINEFRICLQTWAL